MKSDEYITTVTFMFGAVKAGFANVEIPQVYVKVLANLPNGYEFANKADVGGKYGGGEWIVSNSTWKTTVYNPQKPQNNPSKLPKTGW